MSDQIALDALIGVLRSAIAADRRGALSVDPETAARILNIARENKILSLVHQQLGESMAAEALAGTALTMVANSALLQELVALVPALQDAGISFLVIKGPVQQRLIHGTFFQRPAADLDLLVRATDFPHAKRILAEQGYALSTPSVWWRSVLGEEHFHKRAVPHLAVDLHHRVHQPGAPAPSDADCLFSATESVPFGGIEIPTLTAANAMLLCTISIAKALYNREPSAAYLHDLYVWLMAAEPNTVTSFLSRARGAGLGGHASLALALMNALYGSRLGAAECVLPLNGLAETDLQRMILTPRDPATRWPRRRVMLWELCERQPVRYGREIARIIGSELTRRLFERGAPARSQA